jgi:hypothetical protein
MALVDMLKSKSIFSSAHSYRYVYWAYCLGWFDKAIVVKIKYERFVGSIHIM